jgi:hypothetical protein
MTAHGIHVQVTLDCEDPHRMAAFWAAALHYEVEQVDALVRQFLADGIATDDDVLELDGALVWKDGAACHDPAGKGPRMYFQRVPEPKLAKNRMHLDLHGPPGHREDEVTRLEALGATALYEAEQGPHRWTTMADPEGNEFCVA